MKSTKFLPLLSAVFLLCIALSVGYLLGRSHVHGLTVDTSRSTPAAAAVQTDAPTQPDPTQPENLFPLDLNTATAEELELLPGIGAVLAANIVAYRESHGAFSDPARLLDVPGIGEKKYEAAAPYITVSKEESHENTGS